jgi:hypothetical protein
MKQGNGQRSGELERIASHRRQWRGRKRGRGRIPEDLLEQAASLCAEHGVSRVSRELRLDYHGLKRRVTSARASRREPGEFVEIPGGFGGGWTECRVELEALEAGAISLVAGVGGGRGEGTGGAGTAVGGMERGPQPCGGVTCICWPTTRGF